MTVALLILVAAGQDPELCVERFNAAGALYNDAIVARQNKAESFLKAAQAFEAFLERAADCPKKESCQTREKIADGYFCLGTAYFEGGAPFKAVEPLKTFAAQFPQHAHAGKARYLLGKAHYDLGDYENAAAAFGQVSENLADAALYWQGESFLKSAERMIADKKDATSTLEKAVAVYEKLITQFGSSPRVSDALYSMAWCFLIGKRWEKALKVLEKLGTAVRYREEAFFWRGECAFQLKDYASAAAFYEEAGKLPGDFRGRAWLGKGWAHFSQKQYADAGRSFQSALETLAESFPPEARLAYGESLYRSAEDATALPKALQVLAPLVEKENELSDDALYLLTLTYDKRGAPEEARKALAAAITQYPKSNLRAEMLLLQGDLYVAEAERHSKEGRRYEANRAYLDAERAYEPLVQGPSRQERAFPKMVAVLAAQKKHPEAALLCEEFKERYPQSPFRTFALFTLAESYAALQQFPKALRAYQAVVDHEPDQQYTPKALYRMGDLLRETGEFESAARCFRRLSNEHPQSPLAREAAYFAAAALYTAQNFADAHRLFSDFAGTHSKDHPDSALKARVYAGICLARQKMFQKARSTLAEVYYDIVQPRGGVPPASLREYPFPPMNVPEGTDLLLYELLWVCKELGDLAGAQECLDLLLTDPFGKSPFQLDALFESAGAAYAAKNYPEAIANYKRILVVLPEGSGKHDREILEGAFYKLGWSHFQIENYRQAAEAFSKLLEKFPEGPFAAEACFMVGESWMHHPDFPGEKARQAFETVAEKYSTASDWHARSLLRLGDCLGRMNRWDESAKSYRRLLDTLPASAQGPAALYGIGLALQKQGKVEEALAGFEAAKSADGSQTEISPKSQFMIGEIHFQRRKFDDAVAAFQRVWRCYTNPEWSSRALYEAAKAHKELKQWAEAARTYEHLIQEFPKTPQAREAMKDLPIVQKLAEGP